MLSVDNSLKSTNNSLKTSSTSITSKYFSDSDSFKYVLSSKNSVNTTNTNKANSFNQSYSPIQNKDTSNVQQDTKDSDVDEVKDKLDDSDDDKKSKSKDDQSDALNELMNLLNKLGVDSNSIQNIIKEINEDTSSSNNTNSGMEKLMQLLKTDSVKNGLDANSSKALQGILSKLSESLSTDKTGQSVLSDIKDLMSELSKVANNKSGSEKVTNLQDLLNKNYSQDNKEQSTGSDSNTSSKNTTGESKEEKFLNSLLNDDSDSSLNKINLFAARTQVVQNQGVVDGTKSLAINKATFTDDLIRDFKYMSNNGLKELTVKINPGNLGEITINLTQEDGVMKANIKASSKDTANLLMQNLADIKNQLNDKNIKIDEVNIELYQQDTTFFSNEGFDNQFAQEQQKNSSKSNQETTGISLEDESIDSTQAIDNGNVNFLA